MNLYKENEGVTTILSGKKKIRKAMDEIKTDTKNNFKKVKKMYGY